MFVSLYHFQQFHCRLVHRHVLFSLHSTKGRSRLFADLARLLSNRQLAIYAADATRAPPFESLAVYVNNESRCVSQSRAQGSEIVRHDDVQTPQITAFQMNGVVQGCRCGNLGRKARPKRTNAGFGACALNPSSANCLTGASGRCAWRVIT